MIIESKTQLRQLYSQPKPRAMAKQLDQLDQHAKNFIAHSPFVVLATLNSQGRMDASPRGGSPGFVKVLNNNRILLPDASGNNRLDSLENILEQNQVGLIFMIPGVDETLRLNGSCSIRVEDPLQKYFKDEKKAPIALLDIHVEEVFLHCAKAFMRSRLWSPAARIERSVLPTMGQMIKDQINAPEPAESQESMLERYRQDIE